MEITGAAEVRAVLANPAYVVPPVPEACAPVGIAWLRATVSRFSNGDVHVRRRALACAELERLDVAALRNAARERTVLLLRNHSGEPSSAMALAAQTVPVEALASALGITNAVAPAVAVVASSYQPHTAANDVADRAVACLVRQFGGVCDELAAG